MSSAKLYSAACPEGGRAGGRGAQGARRLYLRVRPLLHRHRPALDSTIQALQTSLVRTVPQLKLHTLVEPNGEEARCSEGCDSSSMVSNSSRML